MGILANTRSGVPGRWVMVPKDRDDAPSGLVRRRNRVIRRRRDAFQRLVVSAGATLVLGIIPPLNALLWIHLFVDALLVIYVVQLRRWRAAELQRARVVRQLPPEIDLTDEALTEPVAAVEFDDDFDLTAHRSHG